jgi:hypothetical protein
MKYVEVSPPAPDEPTPYAFAQQGTLAAALLTAGFEHVDEVTHRPVLPWPGSPLEFCQHVREASDPFRRALELLPAEQMPRVLEEVQAALRNYFDGQQVNLPACVHVVTGVR